MTVGRKWCCVVGSALSLLDYAGGYEDRFQDFCRDHHVAAIYSVLFGY